MAMDEASVPWMLGRPARKRTSSRRVAIVSTVSSTLEAFHLGHARELVGRGYEVTLVSSSQFSAEIADEFDIEVIPMRREIAIRDDLISWYRLTRLFKRGAFDIVVAGTPK